MSPKEQNGHVERFHVCDERVKFQEEYYYELGTFCLAESVNEIQSLSFLYIRILLCGAIEETYA